MAVCTHRIEEVKVVGAIIRVFIDKLLHSELQFSCSCSGSLACIQSTPFNIIGNKGIPEGIVLRWM